MEITKVVKPFIKYFWQYSVYMYMYIYVCVYFYMIWAELFLQSLNVGVKTLTTLDEQGGEHFISTLLISDVYLNIPQSGGLFTHYRSWWMLFRVDRKSHDISLKLQSHLPLLGKISCLKYSHFCTVGSFTWKRNIYQYRFQPGFRMVMRICCIDQQRKLLDLCLRDVYTVLGRLIRKCNTDYKLPYLNCNE